MKLLGRIDRGIFYAPQEFGLLKCSPGGDLAAKPANFVDKTPIRRTTQRIMLCNAVNKQLRC